MIRFGSLSAGPVFAGQNRIVSAFVGADLVYGIRPTAAFSTALCGVVRFYDDETGRTVQPLTSSSGGIVSPYKEKIGTDTGNILGVDCAEAISSVGDAAFCSCQNLSAFSGPGITQIGESSFYACSNLSAVDCPNAAYIGSDAFNTCEGLVSVDFPSADLIGACAFRRCRGLVSAYIPAVSLIDTMAFYHCVKLSSVVLSSAPVAPQAAWGIFEGAPLGYTVWVADAAYRSYLTADCWKDVTSHVSSVTQPVVSFLSGPVYDTLVKAERLNYSMSAVPPTPVREGYELTGWAGSYVDVTADVSCFAQWKELIEYGCIHYLENDPNEYLTDDSGNALVTDGGATIVIGRN